MLDESTASGYGAGMGTSWQPRPQPRRSCGRLPRWHVVAAVPGHALAAESALSADGWCVFLPLHLARRASHPPQTRPLFGPYLFIQFDPHDTDWPRICRTRFVAGLLGAPGAPAAVPPGVVEQLQARTSDRRIVDDPLAPEAWRNIPAGASVEVVEGPLASLRGLVTLSSRDRCRVLLSLLGRECVMDLPAQALAVA
jgi:transcription antitermination factor NusG